LNLPASSMISPQDGLSLVPLFANEIGARKKPIPFRYAKQTALIDNRFKLIATSRHDGAYALYDLKADARETQNLRDKYPEVYDSLLQKLSAFNQSVEKSLAG